MSIKIKDYSQVGGCSFVHAEASNVAYDRVCFGYVKEMISLKNPEIRLFFPDITSQMLGDDYISDEYLKDIDTFLGKFFVETRKVAAPSKQTELIELGISGFYLKVKPRFVEILADTSKVHGSLFLGTMNLYKQVGEQPLVPITYHLLKKNSKLRFYQRLVAAHILVPQEFLGYARHRSSGQHTAFCTSWVHNIKGLTLKDIHSSWKNKRFFDRETSLATRHSFVVDNSDLGRMNMQMLPPPWGRIPQPPQTSYRTLYEILNETNILSLLNPKD